jgi:hypothetical protein
LDEQPYRKKKKKTRWKRKWAAATRKRNGPQEKMGCGAALGEEGKRSVKREMVQDG